MNLKVVVAALMVLGVPGVSLADERSHPTDAQTVTVRLSDYTYTPSRIELRRDQPVELRLVNEGKVLHEFVTDALLDTVVDVEGEGVVVAARGLEELEVPAGATVVLRFTPIKAGQFEVRCDAQDPVAHFDEGMKATLVIR